MDKPVDRPVPDVVLFFDANMPKMDECDSVHACKNKNLVLCRHRFNFNAHLADHGNLYGLNDFHVTIFFLDLIEENHKWNCKPRPKFVLITKDIDFIKDARCDYYDALQDDTVLIDNLEFIGSSIKRNGLELRVVVIKHRPFGDNRESDLRHLAEELNRRWARNRLSY